MLKIREKGKRARRFGFSALLTACLLAGTTPVSADDSFYRTTTVEYGTMSVEAQMSVSCEYTQQTEIQFEYPCGVPVFMGYLVKRDDYVIKGQPIAEIEIRVDDIAVEELRLKLQRAEEARDAYYENMEKQLENAKRAAEENTGTQKTLAGLRLEQLEMEFEKNRVTVDEGVEALQEELEAYESAAEVTQILAPESGMVGWLNYYKNGEILPNDTVLGGIYSRSNVMFYITDQSGVLRYGMKVTFTDKTKRTYAGTVVSCPGKYLSEGFETNTAYIRPDVMPEVWEDLQAAYETIHIENVLLVSESAVKSDKNGSYVVELEDGKLTKRYFTAGKTVKGVCYVIDGLTEGMTVVIQ